LKNKSSIHCKCVEDHEKAVLIENTHRVTKDCKEAGNMIKRSKNHGMQPKDQEAAKTKAAKESLRQNNGKIPKKSFH
jgi:hypothetical protein